MFLSILWHNGLPLTLSALNSKTSSVNPNFYHQIVKKGVIELIFELKALIVKLRVFIEGHIVAMVTCSIKRMTGNLFTNDWAFV